MMFALRVWVLLHLFVISWFIIPTKILVYFIECLEALEFSHIIGTDQVIHLDDDNSEIDQADNNNLLLIARSSELEIDRDNLLAEVQELRNKLECLLQLLSSSRPFEYVAEVDQ